MKIEINLDTESKIDTLIHICSKLNCKVDLVDDNGHCVSAKSLLGAKATADWDRVFVECDKDIFIYIQTLVIK